MRQVGVHVGLAADEIIKSISTMGVAVRGAGDRYEVEDSTLAGGFTGLF